MGHWKEESGWRASGVRQDFLSVDSGREALVNFLSFPRFSEVMQSPMDSDETKQLLGGIRREVCLLWSSSRTVECEFRCIAYSSPDCVGPIFSPEA